MRFLLRFGSPPLALGSGRASKNGSSSDAKFEPTFFDHVPKTLLNDGFLRVWKALPLALTSVFGFLLLLHRCGHDFHHSFQHWPHPKKAELLSPSIPQHYFLVMVIVGVQAAAFYFLVIPLLFICLKRLTYGVVTG